MFNKSLPYSSFFLLNNKMSEKNSLEIDGNLSQNPFAELLAELSQMKLSGSLRISDDQLKMVIYVDEGEVVFAVSNSRKHRLFEILLSQNQLSKDKLAKIENFTNDLYLAKYLVTKEIFKKHSVNAFFVYQIKAIINSGLNFKTGEWKYSPLARIKESMRFKVNTDSTLYKYSQTIESQSILERFKSYDEKISVNANKAITDTSFSPQEAFLLSRLSETALSIDSLKSMTGIPNEDILQILYKLWLGGFIKRTNWNSAFSQEDISKIISANLTLKTSALSVEEEQKRAAQRKLEEEQRIAEEAAKQKELEEKAKSEKANQISLSLEEYINRIEDAATHYEIFNITPDATLAEIKKEYFTLAKQFHPDLYYKKVESEEHSKIQHAFTEIAQAYETLKDEEAREVYDFKLRKVIEKLRNETEEKGESLTKEDLDISNQASMASDNFDKGYDYLMNEDFETALPFLGRATHLNESNPRYHAFYGKALSFDKKKRHEAEKHLQTAIKLDSKNTVFRIMLVELLIDIGLVTRAKGELNRLLKIAPNSKEAKSLLDSLADK